MEEPRERKSPEERKELLARQIQTLVVHGRYIESQSDYRAVLARKWLWLMTKREVVEVDEYGNVSVQQT
jgi:hypothetical protein